MNEQYREKQMEKMNNAWFYNRFGVDESPKQEAKNIPDRKPFNDLPKKALLFDAKAA